MNASDALIKTLVANGLEVIFANPGTSEMHLVASIDNNPEIRPVLGLFEGVVTGAADGYARMAEKSAANLLHLGPGLGNGFANIHNAKKARSPMLNIVGDHATYHLKHNAPLTSDLDNLAKSASDWVGRATSSNDLCDLGNTAWQKANAFPGQISTLIVPADSAWGNFESKVPAPLGKLDPEPIDESQIKKSCEILQKDNSMLFIGGKFLNEECVTLAAKISSKTGCRLVTDTFVSRIRRGEGLPIIEQVPYFAESATEFLKNTSGIVFIGSRPPVSFFAYPEKESFLTPESTEILILSNPEQDGYEALRALVDESDGKEIIKSLLQTKIEEMPKSGELNVNNLGILIANLMPEESIISDEAATSSFLVTPQALKAKPHDWLTLTGGSIGQGLPVAVGAAIAKPDRPVIALHGDGGAMYTIQAMWSQARENLNITNIIFANNSYEILKIELSRVGAIKTGKRADSMLSLENPAIDWISLSKSMGVPSYQPNTVEDFVKIFSSAVKEPGPTTIVINI